MRKLFNQLKISEKFFLIIGIMMLFVCVVFFYVFRVVAQVYEERIYREAAELLNLSSSIVERELTKIEKLSFLISTDAIVQENLSFIRENVPNYETFRVRETIYNRLMMFIQQENYITSLQIIDSQGEPITTIMYNILEHSLDVEAIAWEGEGSNRWVVDPTKSDLLLSIRQVRGIKNLSLAHYGILAIWIHMDRLVSQQLDLSKDKRFVIMMDDQLVYATKPVTFSVDELEISGARQGFTIQQLEGEDVLVAFLKSKSSPLTYYNIVPYEYISQQTDEMRNVMIGFFALVFLLVLIIGRMVARSITKPLASLADKMKQVQRGHFDIAVDDKDDPNMDETGQLHRNFRVMIEKINELFAENNEKQRVIQETEYRALQAQINPHFLYNTLDTIFWMAKMNKQQQIAEMVEALAHMLRNVITKKDPLIPLQEELDIVNDYITIQKHRFEDRLDFRLHEDVRANDCLIPKLTLQPVIENAIQHVLEMNTGVCRVELTVRLMEYNLVITVADNGPGFNPIVLEQWKKGNVISKKAGIGLKNIEERVHMLFGMNAKIEIDSDPHKGTTVRFVLPARSAEETDENATVVLS